MVAKTGRERRRSRRVPVQIQIQYRTADGFFQDYIRNLSLGGIFIQTEEPLPTKTRLQVEFCLPDMSDPITAEGVVVHAFRGRPSKESSLNGMGIRFAELNPSSKKRLEFYLQSQAGAAAP